MKFDAFVGPSYTSLSLAADAQRSLNLFWERIESEQGKNRAVLYGTPGLKALTTGPGAPIRSIWVGENRLFVAAGANLYEVVRDEVLGYQWNLRGNIGPENNTPVEIYSNGAQLMIISSGLVYIDTGTEIIKPQVLLGSGMASINGYDVTWVSGDKFTAAMVGANFAIAGTTYTVESVTDAEHLTVTGGLPMVAGPVAYKASEDVKGVTGAYLDTYFIVQVSFDSKEFRVSQPNDGQADWDALDLATKEGYPDNLNGILADHEDLWLMGNQTTEVWRAKPDPGITFPFERDPGAFVHMGNIAPWSRVRLLTGPAWLGGDPRGWTVAYRARGFQPERISTHAIEEAWRKYSTKSDAIAYTYIDRGHEFWVINFPSGNATWVFDATSGAWHERGWWNGASVDRHRAAYHGYVWGMHVVGDWATGTLYEMSHDYLDDGGVQILRERTAPHISEELLRITHPRFQLDMAMGEGTGAEADPVMTLDWSDNNGKTFSAGASFPNGRDVVAGINPEDGKLRRAVWRRNGEARDRIYRVRSFAKILHCWVNAYLGLAGSTN